VSLSNRRLRFTSAIGVVCVFVTSTAWSVTAVETAGAQSRSPYTIVEETQLSGTANQAPVAPEASAAFKAAFAGTPAKIVVCDDQGTTTGNIECQHEAVADHAVAFTVGQSNQDQSVVDKANIPVVGVANDTSPQSFDISGQQGYFAGMAVALHKLGCKRLGQLVAEGGQSYADQTAKAEPWQSVTDAFMPLGAPDVSPEVAKLVQAHVQCADIATVGSQIGQVLTAMKQAGLHVPVALPGAVVTTQEQQSLGSLGNGLILVETTPPLSSPAVAAVAKKMHKVDKSITIDALSLTGWVNARIIQDGIAGVHGQVTNTSLMKALNKLRNANTDGLYPPISMKPGSNPAAVRDFDTYVNTVVLKNGQMTQPSGFFNVGPEINVALTNR